MATRWSTASIIWTVGSSGWRRSSPPWAQRWNAFRHEQRFDLGGGGRGRLGNHLGAASGRGRADEGPRLSAKKAALRGPVQPLCLGGRPEEGRPARAHRSALRRGAVGQIAQAKAQRTGGRGGAASRAVHAQGR